MLQFKNLLHTFFSLFITNSERSGEIPETREVLPPENREVSAGKPITDSFACPYCSSQKFQKRGFRQKKRERVQLYFCQNCSRTFTAHATRGKHYPLSVMLDALSIYHLGYSLEATCRIVDERLHGTGGNGTIQPSTLADWLSEFAELLPFTRMREFAMKRYAPKDMVAVSTLVHQQLYRYRFHRAKAYLCINEEYQHRKFAPVREFLEAVPSECPHHYFSTGLRASEAPLTFSKTQMIVRGKTNYATRMAAFVLQSVKERKGRHEAIQKFFLACDSVTVATEVPVYITRDDMLHMKSQLGFEIFRKKDSIASLQNDDTAAIPKLITGHIDILQIRNGQIHILDYKPNAEKEKPIEQLTLYAMALSRLTGLRLFEFKCAWFDEKDYFEFYPLHVLHKTKKAGRRRKIETKEGIYTVNQNPDRVEKVRPV